MQDYVIQITHILGSICNLFMLIIEIQDCYIGEDKYLQGITYHNLELI